MRKGVVYGIEYIPERKIIYVGCTVNFEKRKKEHFVFREGKNQPIQRFIKESGSENFRFVVLLEQYVSKTSDLYRKEKELIQKYNTYNSGYNKNKGGSAVEEGSKNPNARKIICKNNGEIFDTAKDACLKYCFDISDFSSHLNGRKYKNGIGQRKHGVALIFEYLDREKDNRYISDENRKKMSSVRSEKNKKPLRDLNTGKEYDSLRFFAREMGYNYTSLSAHLGGSKKLKKFEHLSIEYIKKV